MRGLLALLITASCVDAYATVNSEVSTQTYACDGLTAAYIVPFSYQHPTDLTVTSTTSGGVSSTLTYGSSFTLSLSSTPTRATLTLTAPATSCPSGNKLLISRKVPNTQPTSLGTQGRYYPQTVEGMFDWLEYQNQQTNVRIDNILSYDGGTSITLQDGGVAQGSITALNCTGDAVTCSASAGVGRFNDIAPVVTKSYSWAKEVFAPDGGNTPAIVAIGHGSSAGVTASSGGTGIGGIFVGNAASEALVATAGAYGVAISTTGALDVVSGTVTGAAAAASNADGADFTGDGAGVGVNGTGGATASGGSFTAGETSKPDLLANSLDTRTAGTLYLGRSASASPGSATGVQVYPLLQTIQGIQLYHTAPNIDTDSAAIITVGATNANGVTITPATTVTGGLLSNSLDGRTATVLTIGVSGVATSIRSYPLHRFMSGVELYHLGGNSIDTDSGAVINIGPTNATGVTITPAVTISQMNTAGFVRNTSGGLLSGGNKIDLDTCIHHGTETVLNTTAFGRVRFDAATTLTNDSNMTTDIAGGAVGTFAAKLTTDATCAAGTIYLTVSNACNTAVGTSTTATINISAIPAGTTLYACETTACAATDPDVNLCIHRTIP